MFIGFVDDFTDPRSARVGELCTCSSASPYRFGALLVSTA
jgi:hypothetical protein